MSIACDEPGCTAQTRQPLPHGWTPFYAAGAWSHLCPQHSGVPGLGEAHGGGDQASGKRRGKR